MGDPTPESWGFLAYRSLADGTLLGVLPLIGGRARLVRAQGWGVLEGW